MKGYFGTGADLPGFRYDIGSTKVSRARLGGAFKVRSALMSKDLTESTNGRRLDGRGISMKASPPFLQNEHARPVYLKRRLLLPFQNGEKSRTGELTNPTNTGTTMSGSAAPKSTKGQQAFEPDFKAKEVVERDDTWLQKRFGTEKDLKTVAGTTGKAPKSGGRGQQKPAKKTRVRINLFV